MDFTHCTNCGKKTGHKRSLGIGTIFAVLLTSGFWLLAIPFYPKRCIVCGQSADRSKQETSGKKWISTWMGVLILLVLLVLIISALSSLSRP